jgi:predicted KAP-like P-loop ATPase
VVDFPGISYVLAYDTKRVIQALGAGVHEKEDQEERGRAYLEKIVQFQIPLPVTFDDETARMLTAELLRLQADLQLPENFQNIKRYQTLVGMLSVDIVKTPRDIVRLAGTFHVLAGMLRGEVDWIDLLAYCALLIKAPQTVEAMRLKPSEFSEEVLSEASFLRRVAQEKFSVADRLKALIPNSENREGVRRAVGFLFPTLSETGSRQHEDRTLALYRRRPLLTTLRLGLLPGDYPRSAIETLVLLLRCLYQARWSKTRLIGFA